MSYAFVNGQKDFNALCSSISGHKYIAIDTESNSLYAYKERLCLMQISSETINAVVDMLAVNLKPMLPIFANPQIEKIFHSADSDIRVFKATAKCRFVNIFDTMVASKYLGLERCGLDSLVNRYFGISLNKKFQKADWGRRPLTRDMLDYAAGDTQYLKRLRDIMRKELDENGKLAEAEGQFAHICGVEPHPPHFDENGFITLRGARQLNGRGLAVLRELYLARENVAVRRDMPPFKIISEDLMLRLSVAPREALEHLPLFKGVSSYVLANYGAWIREAVKNGLTAPEFKPPRREQDFEKKIYMNAVRERFQAMKKWRKAVALRRNMLPEAVLDNVSLEKLAFAQPHTLEDIQKIKGISAEKIAVYGDSLLEFFRGHRIRN